MVSAFEQEIKKSIKSSLVSQKRKTRRAAFGRLPFRAHPESDPSCHGPAAARKPTYLYRIVDMEVLPLDPKLLDSAFVFFSLRAPQTHTRSAFPLFDRSAKRIQRGQRRNEEMKK